jgi:V8-like Glu-specific endopeptidase
MFARTKLSFALSTVFAVFTIPIADRVEGNADIDPINPPAGQLQPPGDRAMEPFARESYVQFLHATARIHPNPAAYEFLGYVRPANSGIWIHNGQRVASLRELLTARGISFESTSHDAGRGILVSADGRAYIEREQAYRPRVARVPSMPESRASRSAGPDHLGREALGFGTLETSTIPASGSTQGIAALNATNGPAIEGEIGIEPPPPLADTIFDGDGRTLVTTSSYPWRAVGVALLKSDDDSWSRGTGSAAMIGPRAALTVAHAITKNGRDWNVLGVGPAARGYSWCDGTGLPDAPTCKFPFGLRWVQWYYWPGQWDGDGITYDYGVLILADLNWSPGWVNFGYQTTIWLDYSDMNTAGYPAPSKSCAASPDADGECGGYMYRQYENTTSVFTNTAYYKFDVQEGQSGAPIYAYDAESDDRVVYIIHKGSDGPYAYGKRLRSGSFNTICGWVGNWPSSYFNNVSC